MRDVTAYIKLTDWSFSLGGEHFCADLWFDSNSVDIKHEITEGQAGRMNKKDGTRMNRPGDLSTRFETKESAVTESVKQCRKMFPEVKLILVGSPAYREPHKVAWAEDENVQKKLTEINTSFEELRTLTDDPWRTHEDLTEQLCSSWDTTIEHMETNNGNI